MLFFFWVFFSALKTHANITFQKLPLPRTESGFFPWRKVEKMAKIRIKNSNLIKILYYFEYFRLFPRKNKLKSCKKQTLTTVEEPVDPLELAELWPKGGGCPLGEVNWDAFTP